MMLQQIGDDPLNCRFTCWCGRKNEGRFDDLAERRSFLLSQGVKIEPNEVFKEIKEREDAQED